MESLALTSEEHDDLRSRMCATKKPLTFEQASRSAWISRNVRNDNMGAYPCPFHGEGVWHVGHYPSIERMKVLARFLVYGEEGG